MLGIMLCQPWVKQDMQKSAVKVKQATLERAIRAVLSTGLPILRVIVRADGYAIETTEDGLATEPSAAKRIPVL